jgi:DNA-binding NarL/FixJ family response regulator
MPAVSEQREPAERAALRPERPEPSLRPSQREVDERPDATMTVLVYSDDFDTRQQVKLAVGRRPAPDVPRVQWLECATGPGVIAALDKGGVDVAILDGEAAPTGGLGIARQVKDEIYQCPPILVLTGRVADNWLAAWSRAEAAVPHPLDPIVLAGAVADLMRRRRAELTVRT